MKRSISNPAGPNPNPNPNPSRHVALTSPAPYSSAEGAGLFKGKKDDVSENRRRRGGGLKWESSSSSSITGKKGPQRRSDSRVKKQSSSSSPSSLPLHLLYIQRPWKGEKSTERRGGGVTGWGAWSRRRLSSPSPRSPGCPRSWRWRPAVWRSTRCRRTCRCGGAPAAHSKKKQAGGSRQAASQPSDWNRRRSQSIAKRGGGGWQ